MDTVVKPQVKYLEQPPADWFVLDVMQCHARGRDWTALMIDVDPDHYRAGFRAAQQCWVRIAGKHGNRTAAWNALENMMATRH
jgi:hypothetical protein